MWQDYLPITKTLSLTLFDVCNGIHVLHNMVYVNYYNHQSHKSQHGGCWWPGAYLAPGHLQPSLWQKLGGISQGCPNIRSLTTGLHTSLSWFMYYHALSESILTQVLSMRCSVIQNHALCQGNVFRVILLIKSLLWLIIKKSLHLCISYALCRQAVPHKTLLWENEWSYQWQRNQMSPELANSIKQILCQIKCLPNSQTP